MKCRRCGREFTESEPPVAKPEGIREIATVEWCADCNAFAMYILYKGRLAYRSPRIVKIDKDALG